MIVSAVVPLYPPGSRVGAWLATHGLLRGLADRGHRVIVVALFGGAKPYVLDGVTVLSGTEHVPTAVRGADAVISHLGDNGLAHRLALTMGVPSVRMVHGGSALAVRGLRGAALVVCNSQATREAVGRWADQQSASRIVVVRPYTDPAAFATTPGRCLTLVNLAPEKGGELFWKIARLLPQHPFLGVEGGYGSQAGGRLANVEILPQTEDMRTDVYARTKLLLMPSTHESWGMVGVEAMASGIPVLARPTPGLAESLGSAGNWVDSNKADEWAAEIGRMLRPKVWAAASARSLARSAELDLSGGPAAFADAIEALS